MAEQQGEHAIPTAGRSRGPNIHSGGEQDIGAPVPPYEGRQTSGKDKDQLIEEGRRSGHDAPPREISREEQEGVSPTDTSAASPLGVGESSSTQGNERKLGESEESHRKDRLETSHSGIGQSEPIDPDSPNMQPGDQGG